MPPVTRANLDTHSGICSHGLLCCPHSVSGVFIQGSPNVLTNGRPTVRLNDALVSSCPHCGGVGGRASSASGTVFANGRGVVRAGDSVVYPGGGGTVNNGSPNVNAGG